MNRDFSREVSLRIYVASSWRCEHQPEVVRALRKEGHEVYDFKNPAPGNNGFHWSEIDPEWKCWGPEKFKDALEHPIAQEGYWNDYVNLYGADATILVMPCGRSAHLELGYAIGDGQITGVLLNGPCEPELMYKLADFVALSIDELVAQLSVRFDARKFGSLPKLNRVL